MRRAAVTVALSTALILAGAGCSATPTSTVASPAAQPTAPGACTGHIDATQLKGTTAGAQKFLDHVTKAGGTGTRALVFVATVDQHGYLTSFKTTFPNLVTGTDVVYGLKLSDFG